MWSIFDRGSRAFAWRKRCHFSSVLRGSFGIIAARVFSLISLSVRGVQHSLCSSWCFPLAFSGLLARVLTVFHLPNLKFNRRSLVANPRHRHGNSCNNMRGYCNLALLHLSVNNFFLRAHSSRSTPFYMTKTG